MKVYADNAATTRISDTAFDAMAPYFKELYGTPSSLYTLPGRLVSTRIAVHNLRGPRLRHFESQPATRLIGLKSLIQLPGIGKFQISEIAATVLIVTPGRQKSRRCTEQKFQFHLRLN